MRKHKMNNKKKQQGASLIWALAILIVLTLLALSSNRSSILKTRVAANEVLLAKAYQGAESALAKDSDEFCLKDTALNGTVNAAGNKEKTFTEVTTGDVATQSTVELIYNGACPPIAVAMSTEMTGSSGGYHCMIFNVTGSARIVGTNAVDTHRAGVIHFVPNTSTTGY
jgi:Tfp pilus assembly protein PilX